MATTVRRVKRLGKRNSYCQRLVPAPCWSSVPQFTEVDGNGDKLISGGSLKVTPPPYRMPPQPLYSEPASIPGSATPSIQQMHTHSNKFPIEREVILSNYDKNSKIPILNEYHKKQKSAAVAPDAPNVQVAWTEDRTNRTYCEIRNSSNSHVGDNINVEYHRTYKAQPLSLLDTTNASEPSPIVNQTDSNGFTNFPKSAGRSHSTPETADGTPKPFPSRTYHTIKDMISSRFSKPKTDQQPETGLNNSETHDNTKPADNTLSPHSQLVQRGVYLASSQSSRTPVPTPGPSGGAGGASEAAKREQMAISANQFRERGVDVSQTVGVSKQSIYNAHAEGANSTKNIYDSCASKKPIPPRPPGLDAYTPNRFRYPIEQRSVSRNQRFADNGHSGNVARNVMRIQNGGEGAMRQNEMSESGSSVTPAVYGRQQTPARSQRIYEHRVDRNPHSEAYSSKLPPSSREAQQRLAVDDANHRMLPTSRSDEYEAHNKHGGASQLPNDTKYGLANAMDRCSISRARSNDHLLDTPCSKSPYARKDLPLKQKSKSFENLGNENTEEEKIEMKENGVAFNGMNSDYEKHRCGGQSDSGRGSTVYSSGKLQHTTDTSPDSSEPHRVAANKDNQWVDMVENELKHILEPKSNASMANSTMSDSSTSPPLPPVSPDVSSDEMTPAYKHKAILYGSKAETSYRSSVPSSHSRNVWARTNSKDKLHQRLAVSVKRQEHGNKIPSTIASSSIDLDSMLDEENNTSDEEVSISDTRAIRKQLEGLENMYSEVMKLLGVKKSALNRYPSNDPRVNRRRLCGSVSSLPSSVSSRPIRDRHRRPEDRKKFVRDIKGINKRFQRLESHVVTLARSVAHLSSEMRTQHLMIQEMEVIRGELTNLRAQTNMLTVRSQTMPRFHQFTNSEQVNSSPDKMKKLTKFFGDEPPLLRLFLKKLGYEKYAAVFEKERIGLVELPYMSEERLQKLGIPMGPRLRIIQEAQLGFPGAHENTLCIV